MKIQSQTLLDGLKSIKPAMTGKTMPILSNFKIEGNKITGTNLNITVSAIIDDLDQEEPITLPYAEVVSICSSVKGELNISPELITSGKSKFQLGEPYDVDTFPKTDAINGLMVVIPENVVVSLKKAATCTSKQESFQVTEHVYLHRSNNKLIVDSTDKWLAYSETFDIPGDDFKAVVPIEIINAIAPDEYNVTISEASIRFENEFIIVSGKLGEGNYPNIEPFFNLESKPFKATFNKRELVSALNEVTVYSILPLCGFQFWDKKANLSIKDDDVNKSASTTINCDCDNLAYTVRLNATFLRKLISFLPEKQENVTLHLTSSTKPIQINADGRGLQLIIMPLMS